MLGIKGWCRKIVQNKNIYRLCILVSFNIKILVNNYIIKSVNKCLLLVVNVNANNGEN